ncbi:prepilin signal peptidase PulO-like enzyme (type II secretory pathway) [Kibdelosporangium banguiense]|uniref:Prepilin signal peptidase PulO-like enzyme (Type II secretory pathway) n=1 Tax=Kibdelosporangium banguiense TaxID=1365924 RepID=A0ABS4TJ12_9PSEU|nr:hypothetical protein [Kibdelosporangium banguiense]MBP2324351.1 prepilin signal peptidase PulO-like enzyme (type II secretory pathway) [Kibdelosporangium banguiense]
MITRLLLILITLAALSAFDVDIRTLSTNLLPAAVIDAEGWSR